MFAIRKKNCQVNKIYTAYDQQFLQTISRMPRWLFYIIPCSFLFTIIIFFYCTMKSEQYLRLQMPCIGMSMDLYFASRTLVALVFLSTIIIILFDMYTICAHVSVWVYVASTPFMPMSIIYWYLSEIFS